MQHLDTFSQSAEYVWRLAKATHLRALNFGLEGDFDRKKDAAFEAEEFAVQVLSLDDNHSQVQKWKAKTLGCASNFLSLQERIKDHIEKAVQRYYRTVFIAKVDKLYLHRPNFPRYAFG